MKSISFSNLANIERYRSIRIREYRGLASIEELSHIHMRSQQLERKEENHTGKYTPATSRKLPSKIRFLFYSGTVYLEIERASALKYFGEFVYDGTQTQYISTVTGTPYQYIFIPVLRVSNPMLNSVTHTQIQIIADYWHLVGGIVKNYARYETVDQFLYFNPEFESVNRRQIEMSLHSSFDLRKLVVCHVIPLRAIRREVAAKQPMQKSAKRKRNKFVAR